MLYIPFQESLKIHTIILRVSPEQAEKAPASIKLFVNRSTILSFDDAANIPATQAIETKDITYNQDGEALVPLRFVKFQRCNSIVMFIDANKSDDEETHLQGIELIGEVCAANSSGVVQKIDHEH